MMIDTATLQLLPLWSMHFYDVVMKTTAGFMRRYAGAEFPTR
jgi:hypothetical protein